MSRLPTLFWIALVALTGLGMFKVKYAVQNLEDELHRVRRQTVAEQQEIRVLHAEWSYLTQPERLTDLNRRFLSLVPITTAQLQHGIDDIPMRSAPADEAAPDAVADAAPTTPAPSQPRTPAMLALDLPSPKTPTANAPAPSKPPSASPLPARMGPPQPLRSIAELVAQIDGER